MLDVEIKLKTSIQQALKEAGADIELDKIIIERSKDKTHGDYATTVAMQMAKTLHKSRYRFLDCWKTPLWYRW